MRVPVVPRSASARRSGLVMRTSSPPASTKPSAASIFGPMLPAGNCPSARWRRASSTLTTSSARSSGRAEVDRDPVDAGRDAQQVGADRAGEQRRGEVLVDHGLDALERARRRRSTTGMPPPPAATTRKPASTSVWIASCSTIRTGCGDATSRRQPRPESSATSHPFSSARRRATASVVEAPDRLRRAPRTRGRRGRPRCA